MVATTVNTFDSFCGVHYAVGSGGTVQPSALVSKRAPCDGPGLKQARPDLISCASQFSLRRDLTRAQLTHKVTPLASTDAHNLSQPHLIFCFLYELLI